ncbi:hypothetical protein BDZ45DRAFT_337372 [Acephala macrosclerotiorum]|nr:hypothetical protein BDZ45DRAFT_337372 [Acephala macrosclerotiorum]
MRTDDVLHPRAPVEMQSRDVRMRFFIGEKTRGVEKAKDQETLSCRGRRLKNGETDHLSTPDSCYSMATAVHQNKSWPSLPPLLHQPGRPWHSRVRWYKQVQSKQSRRISSNGLPPAEESEQADARLSRPKQNLLTQLQLRTHGISWHLMTSHDIDS